VLEGKWEVQRIQQTQGS